MLHRVELQLLDLCLMLCWPRCGIVGEVGCKVEDAWTWTKVWMGGIINMNFKSHTSYRCSMCFKRKSNHLHLLLFHSMFGMTFFLSPPSCKSLLEYAKGIVWQMSVYSMFPSSSNKRKYGNSILRFIDDEVIESLD